MPKMILALMTIALLCFAQTASAESHEDEDTPKASDSNAGSKDKGAKRDEPSDDDEEEDEDEDEDGPPRSAGKSESSVAMADLVHDGFVIRTTVFVPAEAVTRQTGKISGDAIVVTLQKQFSTAICYYALKAYVGEGLTKITSCIVHR